MLLEVEGRAEVTYAGDRMWPAVRHGQTVELEPLPSAGVVTGDVVAINREGAPDLARVAGRAGRGALRLQADADPGKRWKTSPGALLARARLVRGRAAKPGRTVRRLWLDVVEALGCGPGHVLPDAADSVRRKYDGQARYYALLEPVIEEALLTRIRRLLTAGGRVLVAGSGSGRECFALAREGWRAKGIDFSERMVRNARDNAMRHGLEIEFECADLRRHSEPAGSVDLVLFTYDVYSFIPEADDRVDLLRRMAVWLAPRGAILLSARRVRRIYERGILSLQWLSNARRRHRPWGASHTRYIAPDGKLLRSFVHYFTDAALRREVGSAGMRLGAWQGGHAVVERGSAPGMRKT